MLPDISSIKGNQTMEFSQGIDCHTKNIIFEKSSTKCGAETSSKLFLEKLKMSISLDQQCEVSYSLFLLYVQVNKYKTY